MGVKAKLFGLPVTIASDAECEQVSYVVCGDVSHFDDDVHTKCSSCAATIVHRPHVPKTPPKICFPCFITLSAKGPVH